jgi:hypothetical protein
LVNAGVVAYAAMLAFYLVVPAIRDHVEPAVGSVAIALLRGEPPYHGVTGEVSYELPYGPAAFGIHALSFAVLGRSMVALKLSGLLACVGAAALTFSVLQRRASLRCASGGVLIFLLYLAYYDARVYWCRPEPFLLLGSAAALWVARAQPRWSGVGLAVLVAWMLDLKVTGGLYLVPVVALVAEHRSPREAAVAVASGIGLALAAFAVAPFSLGSYADLLERTAHHGLSGHELLLNASAATLLLGPALVARALRPEGPPIPPQRPCWNVPTRSLLASAAVVCLVAAKPGAGRHHLVPFLPLAIDALVDGVDGVERRLPAGMARACTLGGRVVAFGFIVGLTSRSASTLHDLAARARRDAIDLRAILDDHPDADIAMGYGDASSYPDTFGRLAIAFRSPLRLDGASQMDATAAGYPASRMLGAGLARCRPALWVVPDGEPFSLASYYAGEPVFDAAFREAFARGYALIARRGAYRVYRCRG